MVVIVVASILVIDQLLKILVKTHLTIGEEIMLIGEWCRLHFIENEGFAFGMAFGGSVGKLVLTLFRVVASGWIIWYIAKLIKRGSSRTSFIACLAVILAGALGNARIQRSGRNGGRGVRAGLVYRAFSRRSDARAVSGVFAGRHNI